jgi:hypothetical protein
MLAEVHAYGLTPRAGVIVIETAIVESGIRIFANPNVPGSMAIPHEGVGTDHASVGVLQQQVPMWGNVRDCMDPATSTRKFLDRLVQFNWQSMRTGDAAQRVQVSAYPDRYQQQEQWAIQIVNALWPSEDNFMLDPTPAQLKALADAFALAVWTHDLANGPAVAQAYQVLDNTQAAVAAFGTQLAAQGAEISAIKNKVGA